jgi:hypothetical protein
MNRERERETATDSPKRLGVALTNPSDSPLSASSASIEPRRVTSGSGTLEGAFLRATGMKFLINGPGKATKNEHRRSTLEGARDRTSRAAAAAATAAAAALRGIRDRGGKGGSPRAKRSALVVIRGLSLANTGAGPPETDLPARSRSGGGRRAAGGLMDLCACTSATLLESRSSRMGTSERSMAGDGRRGGERAQGRLGENTPEWCQWKHCLYFKADELSISSLTARLEFYRK